MNQMLDKELCKTRLRLFHFCCIHLQSAMFCSIDMSMYYAYDHTRRKRVESFVNDSTYWNSMRERLYSNRTRHIDIMNLFHLMCSHHSFPWGMKSIIGYMSVGSKNDTPVKISWQNTEYSILFHSVTSRWTTITKHCFEKKY